MKILHIASFVGNVGDILSNEGFKTFLRKSPNTFIRVTELEIRNFFKNRPVGIRLSMDTVLEDAYYKFDRVVIGGGGFLDYWIHDSSTATTIEISPQILRKFGSRLIISSVGAYPHKEIPVGNYEKFQNFLNELKENKTSLMFRNDGTLEHLKSQFDTSVASGLRSAGDHCYLLTGEQHPIDRFEAQKPYIAVNIGPDQLLMRSGLRSVIQPAEFYRSLAQGLCLTADTMEADIKFVPHLPVDLSAIHRLCELMPDLFVRERVSVHSYSGQRDILDSILGIYQNASVSICGRLHANITSIILDRPTVTLGILDRVRSVSQQHPNSVLIGDFDAGFATSLLQSSVSAIERKSDGSAIQIKQNVEDFLSSHIL